MSGAAICHLAEMRRDLGEFLGLVTAHCFGPPNSKPQLVPATKTIINANVSVGGVPQCVGTRKAHVFSAPARRQFSTAGHLQSFEIMHLAYLRFAKKATALRPGACRAPLAGTYTLACDFLRRCAILLSLDAISPVALNITRLRIYAPSQYPSRQLMMASNNLYSLAPASPHVGAIFCAAITPLVATEGTTSRM